MNNRSWTVTTILLGIAIVSVAMNNYFMQKRIACLEKAVLILTVNAAEELIKKASKEQSI